MIPKSKVLTANKSFVADTKINYSSPKQSQHLTVNIQNGEVKDPPLQTIPEETLKYNPYENLTSEQFNDALICKDKMIQALRLIIFMIQENPLIYNKYIIPRTYDLITLIKLLTNSEDVEITIKDDDVDCSCCSISNTDLLFIDKIYVKKNNELINFKYNFSETIKILDQHSISYKITIRDQC